MPKSTTPRGLKFCKDCSRKHHRTEACKVYLRTKQTSTGKLVKRWAK